MRKLIPAFVLCIGCGGSTEAAPPAQLIPASAPISKTEPEARPVESLERAEVLAAVDAGLGYFLQRVDVEPELHDGRFKGFRIVGLYPQGYWAGVDLAPGDVVTQVNGMPIERETQAYAAFESLRSAKELRVSLIRRGRPYELVLPIVESDRAPADENGAPGAPPADRAPQPAADGAG